MEHITVFKKFVFKNLGSLIIDMEQRFGLRRAQEKIKGTENEVDVPTHGNTSEDSSYEPSGIRDMSVLEEAPIDRQPGLDL